MGLFDDSASDASDAAPGAPRVAVMCHRAWVRLFGADPAVIGRTLVLDGTAWTVVGVMPPRFEWNIADLWFPRRSTAVTIRGHRGEVARFKRICGPACRGRKWKRG